MYLIESRQSTQVHRSGPSNALIPAVARPPIRPYSKKEELVDSEADANFHWLREIELYRLSRISPVFSLAKSWFSLAVGSLLALAVVALFGLEAVLTPGSDNYVVSLVARFSLLGALATVVYWELYRRSIELRVKGFRIEVVQGVVKRIRASTALRHETSVYISRSPLQAALGLSTLRLICANTPKPEVLTIPFLKASNALMLKEYFAYQLDRQTGVSPHVRSELEAN